MIMKQELSQEELLSYGGQVLMMNQSFTEFSFSMMEHFGIELSEICADLYANLKKCLPKEITSKMDKASIFEINPSVLIDLYNVKLSQLDKEKEKVINSEIDELNFKIEGYRKSETFRERRDVAAKFHYQSPFNAYLVNLQFPGASLVLTQSQWKKYNRRPTVNARPILYLNFSPLGCLFDISDTEQIPNLPIRTDSEILDEIDNQLRNSSGKVRREYMEHLIENISKLGVFLNTRLEASNQYSGYICYDQEHSVGFVYNKEYIQHRNMGLGYYLTC